MTDPATLSLADLAAAVVRLGAHRDSNRIRMAGEDELAIAMILRTNHADLLLTAANRLPAVVAECERLERIVEAWETEAHEDAPGPDVAALRAECERLRNFAVCAWCGPLVKVDEDGCCAHCGADCMLVADGRATVVPEHWRNDVDAVVSFDAPEVTP